MNTVYTQVADDNRRGELVTVKLPEYLVSLYEYDPQNSATDVFHEIGINRCVGGVGVACVDCNIVAASNIA